MTKLRAARFMRQPFIVTGHQVTEENMEFVAAWCGGEVYRSSERRFIQVPVENARSTKQAEAHVGYWVLKSKYGGKYGFRVYSVDYLEKQFMLIRDDTEDDNDIIIPDDNIPRQVDNVRSLPVQPTPKFSNRVM